MLFRSKYKEKHVPFVRVTLKNGYEVPKYNYLFGRFEDIVNQVTKTYLDNGYSKTEMINTTLQDTISFSYLIDCSTF